MVVEATVCEFDAGSLEVALRHLADRNQESPKPTTSIDTLLRSSRQSTPDLVSPGWIFSLMDLWRSSLVRAPESDGRPRSHWQVRAQASWARRGVLHPTATSRESPASWSTLLETTVQR